MLMIHAPRSQNLVMQSHLVRASEPGILEFLQFQIISTLSDIAVPEQDSGIARRGLESSSAFGWVIPLFCAPSFIMSEECACNFSTTHRISLAERVGVLSLLRHSLCSLRSLIHQSTMCFKRSIGPYNCITKNSSHYGTSYDSKVILDELRTFTMHALECTTYR